MFQKCVPFAILIGGLTLLVTRLSLQFLFLAIHLYNGTILHTYIPQCPTRQRNISPGNKQLLAPAEEHYLLFGITCTYFVCGVHRPALKISTIYFRDGLQINLTRSQFEPDNDNTNSGFRGQSFNLFTSRGRGQAPSPKCNEFILTIKDNQGL